MSKPRTRRLKARAIKFATLVASGQTEISAWRAITPGWKAMPPEQQHKAKYEFVNDPVVEFTIKEVMQNAKVAAMDSHALAHSHTIERERAAFEAGNLTAASQYQRLRLQSGGWLKETFNLTDDHGVSDAELIKKMGKGDPAREALARKLLGNDSFDPPSGNVTPIKPKRSGS